MTLDTPSMTTTVPALRRPAAVKSVAAALLLLLAVVCLRWDTSDDMLHPYGDAVAGPAQVRHTTYVGLFVSGTPRRSTVDVSRRHLRVVTNTADANISVRRCRPRPPGGGIGVVRDDWAPYCTSMDAFTSGALSLDGSHDELVVAITPRRAGVIDLEGVDLSYRHQLRFGRQHVGQHVTLTAR